MSDDEPRREEGPSVEPATAGEPMPEREPATDATTMATEPGAESQIQPAVASPKTIQLYLLRHADAGNPTAWPGDDAERPLSSKGRGQARRLARFLADLRWRPDLILTSPKVRAAETAKIVGRAVGVKPTADERLGTALDLAVLAELLAAHRDARRVMLVGHDPDFSEMATSLAGAAIELKKGALARIDLPDGDPPDGQGSLRWLVPPGLLAG